MKKIINNGPLWKITLGIIKGENVAYCRLCRVRCIHRVIRREKKFPQTLLVTYVKVDMPILVYKATTC